MITASLLTPEYRRIAEPGDVGRPNKPGRVESSIYALACRDALRLGTPERVTLYFVESALRLSTTRTDEHRDFARADGLAQICPERAS